MFERSMMDYNKYCKESQKLRQECMEEKGKSYRNYYDDLYISWLEDRVVELRVAMFIADTEEQAYSDCERMFGHE